MAKRSVTKDAVDSLKLNQTIWDTKLRGFGARRQKGDHARYVLKLRVHGRQQFITIGTHGSPWTADSARKEALRILGSVVTGTDPAAAKAAVRGALTFGALSELYLVEHVEAKRKAVTAANYRDILERLCFPVFEHHKAESVSTNDVARLHYRMRDHPYQANRMLAVVGAMYAFGQRRKLVSTDCNPARGIEKYPESSRRRYLSDDELATIGESLRVLETDGIAWEPNPSKKTKHAPRLMNRMMKIDPFAAAAIRMIIFTGARLSEILNLRWDQVDLKRGVLKLPDSKTGQKEVRLNTPVIDILSELAIAGDYVIASKSPDKPRADLNPAWRLLHLHSKIDDVKNHVLRHTFASKGAGLQIGLPVIGKLLGHKHAVTTQRYAHLADEPTQRAADVIGDHLFHAMNTQLIAKKEK